MKRVLIIILFVNYIILIAEPYRPCPLILVHGYNTHNAKSSNFGLIMKKSLYSNDIAHPIEASPFKIEGSGELHWGTAYYISKFKSDTLEENKLAYKCLENKDTIIK